ncbi:MAG: YezD family protein [Nitrospira sp.]|nr:YezD family protein [Nitrospira sp.]
MSASDQSVANPYSDRAVEQAILLALKGIQFGSVEIIVHDFKVVQIERKEKTRFDRPAARSISRSTNDDPTSFTEEQTIRQIRPSR